MGHRVNKGEFVALLNNLYFCSSHQEQLLPPEDRISINHLPVQDFQGAQRGFSPHCLYLSFVKPPRDRITLAPSLSESLERNYNFYRTFFQQPQVNILQCCLSDNFETWYLYHYWYTSYTEAVQKYCLEQLNTSAATTAVNGNM